MKFSKDFLFEVSRGMVPYHTYVDKYGRNRDVDTGGEDIWDLGATWVAPTTSRTHSLASTSTDDTAAGVGGKTLQISGLTDWDTAEISETVTLNGTSAVNTANTYVIIHRMKMLTWGTSGPNVGVITATAQTDATVTAQIAAGRGQTEMAILGVPSVQTAHIINYYASFNKSGGVAGGVDIDLSLNPIPSSVLTGFLVKHTQGLISTGTSAFNHEFGVPEKYSGPFILKMSADTSADNFDISAGFDLVLVTN